MATTFQRARSDEQRAIRRQTILDTAAAMLAEMPVAELSLNELSRRVGLAKSNVLRYFDSREAVLLELLDSLTSEWLEHLAAGAPLGGERAGRLRAPRRAAGGRAGRVARRAPGAVRPARRAGGGARAQRVVRRGRELQAPRRRRTRRRSAG